METEHFRLGIERQALGVVDVGIRFTVRRSVVQAGRRELVVIGEDALVEVVLEQFLNKDSIVGVCDTPSVIALSRQIFQCIKGRLIWILIQVDFELSN